MFLLFGFYWLSSGSSKSASKSIINLKNHWNNLSDVFHVKIYLDEKSTYQSINGDSDHSAHCSEDKGTAPIRPLDYSVSCHININLSSVTKVILWLLLQYVHATYLFLEIYVTTLVTSVEFWKLEVCRILTQSWFSMTFKWVIKKYLNLTFKVNYQLQKPSESFCFVYVNTVKLGYKELFGHRKIVP